MSAPQVAPPLVTPPPPPTTSPPPPARRGPQYVGPRSEPQHRFLESPADVVIAGGAAGGGKTFSLLLDAGRWAPRRANYGGVIFRRTYPRIRNEGGLWDASVKLYGLFADVVPIPGKLVWVWPKTNATVRFAHLQHEWTVEEWKGSEVPFIGFDQLEEFTEHQFWYMLSRNRAFLPGFRPYARATVNPDPDSFVATLVEWWIDQDTGFAIPERSGVLRWFFRDQISGELVWADDPEALLKYVPKVLPEGITPIGDLIKSFTFIPSTVYDNTALLEVDPGYLGKLMNLPLVERQRLLEGNWKVRHEAGKVFPMTWGYVDQAWWQAQLRAGHVVAVVRYWDKAATEELLAGPDYSWSVGVLMALMDNGYYVVPDVVRGQWAFAERDKVIGDTMRQDRVLYGDLLSEWWEREPGSGGKETAERQAIMAAGTGVRGFYHFPSGSKLERAAPYASAVQNRLVLLVTGPWNKTYTQELWRCPGRMMDQVDASSGAFAKLPKWNGTYNPAEWRSAS